MNTKTATGYSNPFSEKLIQTQVQKIFLCPAFSVSDILRRFLTYIIQETQAGRSNTIKEYTIAVNVLNKPVSFKPQQDAIVRIHAGRLRRALNCYYKEQGQQDLIEISVPKGSYVPVFADTRNTKIKAETDSLSPASDAPECVNLVVLPFQTFETDINRKAFADGLGQQLSAELGRYNDFSVMSYYTTRQLNKKNREIGALAKNYGARLVVSGDVLFEPRKIRVAIQLTDADTGAQIWTELYHHSFQAANLFDVTDHITSDLAGILGDFNGIIIRMVAQGHIKNNSGGSISTVFSAYHDFYINFSMPAYKKSLLAVEKAIQFNPQNDLAWAFQGQLSLLGFLFNQTTTENPLIHGLRCSRSALKINPLSQQAYITLAMTQLFMCNRQAAINAVEQSVRLNPNAAGTMGIAGCLMICIGEYNRGITLIRNSIQLNESCPALFYLFISLYHFQQMEYSEAYEQAEKMGMPDLFLNIILRISILAKLGRKSEADYLIKSLRKRSLNTTWISKDQISRFLLDQELVEDLYKGLKAVHIPVLTVA